jgi:hypothetical protein
MDLSDFNSSELYFIIETRKFHYRIDYRKEYLVKLTKKHMDVCSYDSMALLNMALMYKYKGKYKQWLQKSYKLGNINAEYQCASSYFWTNISSTKPNNPLTIEDCLDILLKLSKKGCYRSCYDIGNYYRDKNCVKESIIYFIKAYNLGHKKAANIVGLMCDIPEKNYWYLLGSIRNDYSAMRNLAYNLKNIGRTFEYNKWIVKGFKEYVKDSHGSYYTHDYLDVVIYEYNCKNYTHFYDYIYFYVKHKYLFDIDYIESYIEIYNKAKKLVSLLGSDYPKDIIRRIKLFMI